MEHKDLLSNLLVRGVEHIYPTKEFLEKRLHENEPLRLYVGYDPTGPTLHIGHGITLLKLRDFQLLGHKIIMLIGDFTAMIGDPTDKSAARVKLNREQVLENCKAYKEQASAIIDFGGENPAELLFNSEWHSKLSFADVVELSSHFTVQRLMERDMFQNRVKEEKPVYLHELMYPLMQGYDSVAMKVDGEVGGNDQTFNMLAGRTLMKDLSQKEKFVLSTKLLVDSSGKKMGKTEGNMVALSDTPEDMFGKVMRWSDEMIVSGFEICTRIPMDQVDEIEKKLASGENPRDFKLELAYEITKQFKGEEAAQQGKDHFKTVIQSGEKPEEIIKLQPSVYDIVTVLKEAGFASSNSDARRAIDGGGVKVNDEKVTDHEYMVQAGDVVQKGKRFFVEIA
ncbi:MAG: tyrosine--tRNA ligase [Candidatus Magasanikbacteria bacterium CG11_big_fil_rev_8_21_14_0_20_39_34]|uniref:Tyrosine--tRNA ligase n=1 Tax=Candidatus Magasanikbacteria bacterium CG11_big_fil_rev_8_21_14_0_20_39_34 TaxID=1974653 RepID=A0A2H0N859_9BACT|nr:MAG: tyrosine--tRNA ligase [Candidatus Magasanikbacteria bacterium CG11_big_fil_rev_8_21_14_0_20_39_34]